MNLTLKRYSKLDYLKIAKNFKAKKRLGQNFLIDEEIIDFIVDTSEIKPEETIIEIGSGLGFVTTKLSQKAKKVIAIEIDTDIIDYLRLLKLNNVDIINKDILKVDFSSLVNNPTKIIANIPYYITTPILLHLLGEIDNINHTNRNLVSEIIIMVQYEVGKRIVATNISKNKEWGALSVLINYWSVPTIVKEVNAKSFWPSPKVNSAILHLKTRSEPMVKVLDPKIFRRVVKASFNFRRKNLKNSLICSGFSHNIVNQALEQLSIDQNTRGESFSINQFATLSDSIFNLQNMENKVNANNKA